MYQKNRWQSDARNILCRDEGISFMEKSIAPEGKRCQVCQQLKDSSEFRPGRNTCKDCNKQQVRYRCRECKTVVKKEERISPGHRTTYCAKCWEEIQGKKKCIGCRVYKDISEFSEDKSRPDGHEYYCKDCRRGHQIDKYAKKIIEKGTKRCLKCRITRNLSEFPRDRRAKDGVGLFCTICCDGQNVSKQESIVIREKKTKISGRVARQIRSRYGISEEEYTEMFEQQEGLCAICGRPDSRKRLLNIDHNHTTGKIRALLCGSCNSGLGMFEDNIEYLQRAIQYLHGHE